MITRFNLYQKVLEDEMAPGSMTAPTANPTTSANSWIDSESLNKGKITSFFTKKGTEAPKQTTEKPVDDTNSVVQTLEEREEEEAYKILMTETSVGSMSAKIYADIMDIVPDGQELDLDLDGNELTEDSEMIDIAYRYYVKNISDIIVDIEEVKSDYLVEGVDEQIVIALKKNPITLGTLINNDIKQWFLTKRPMNELSLALSESAILPKNQVSESNIYNDISEGISSGKSGGKFTFITSLLDISQKMQRSSRVKKAADSFSSASKSGNLFSSKSRLNLSGTYPTTNPINIPSPKAPANPNLNDKSKISLFLEKLKKSASSKLSNVTKGLRDKSNSRNSKINSVIKNLKDRFAKKYLKKAAYMMALFYGPYFLLNTIMEKWLGILDSGDSKDVTMSNFFLVFEEDMISRGHAPFTTYRKIYDDYEFNLDRFGEDMPKIIKGWLESLLELDIIQSPTFDTCVRQLENPLLKTYLEESSNMSKELTSTLDSKWENNITLVTPGLNTIGSIVIFTSLLEKFEDQLYSGKVPIELPKQIKEIKRYDKEGNLREYLTIGDSGEDVSLLQEILRELGIYVGEIDGIYDEEMASLISVIKDDARETNPRIIANGIADNDTLEFIDKLLVLKSEKVQGNIGGKISKKTQDLRSEVAKAIQAR